MKTFIQIKWSNVPQKFKDAIISWGDGVLVVDETLLTPEEQQKGLDWLTQHGYKLQV